MMQARIGLVLAVISGLTAWGCGKQGTEEKGKQSLAPRAGTVKATTPGATLTMILEGLMVVKADKQAGQDVIWALMVDARDPQTTPPPCVLPSIVQLHPDWYPAHEPAIYVEGADFLDEQGNKVTNPFPIAGYEVAVKSGVTGFGGAGSLSTALDALVSDKELRDGWGDANAALQVDPAYFTSTVLSKPGDPLVARIRIDGADSVAARANSCTPPYPPHFFRFARDPDCDSCPMVPGTREVPLAEDVLMKQAGVSAVSLVLTSSGNTRTLTIKPTGTSFGIAFRNTMQMFLKQGIGQCPPSPPIGHFGAYRYLYQFEKVPDPNRCLVAPCISSGPAGGFKCPIGG